MDRAKRLAEAEAFRAEFAEPEDVDLLDETRYLSEKARQE